MTKDTKQAEEYSSRNYTDHKLLKKNETLALQNKENDTALQTVNDTALPKDNNNNYFDNSDAHKLSQAATLLNIAIKSNNRLEKDNAELVKKNEKMSSENEKITTTNNELQAKINNAANKTVDAVRGLLDTTRCWFCQEYITVNCVGCKYCTGKLHINCMELLVKNGIDACGLCDGLILRYEKTRVCSSINDEVKKLKDMYRELRGTVFPQ